MSRKKVVISIFVVVCICMLSACGNRKSGDKLVGKWEAVDHAGEILNFNDDGTYMYTTVNGNNASGSYKISDNEIQMTSDASGLGADLNKVSGLHEYTFDGDTLIFSELGFAATEYSKVK